MNYPKSPEEGTEYLQDSIEKANLNADVIRNAINTTYLALQAVQIDNGRALQRLKPQKTYEEELRDKMTREGKENLIQTILTQSKPDAIAEYNRLVAEYNQQLPRVQKEQDTGTVKLFVQNILRLINV